METINSTPVTTNEILGLASWERPRSRTELLGFLAAKEESLDVADFDF